MKKLYLSALVILTTLGLTGCGTATQNVKVADVSAPIAASKAIIELHRPSSPFGMVRGIDVYDNGKLIGTIKNDTKLVWEREASKMCLTRGKQWEQYAFINLASMLEDPTNPNCFKVKEGQVNRFKFDYLKGMFFSEDDWNALIDKEKKEAEEIVEE